jgi:hypothetical protein
MPPFLRHLVGAFCVLLLPQVVSANNVANVHVARHWHLHQPIYWPEWNSNGSQTQRYQYAWDSLQMKFANGNRYDGSPVRHPQNNLVQGDPEGSFDAVFSPDDRIKAYQAGPKESLGRIRDLPFAGYSMSYSGSLIENVNSFGRNNAYGYAANWNQNFIDIRNWRNQSGQRRHDLVGFTYHHSFGPLIPKSVLRKELQIFKEIYWKTWAGQPDKSDHSKGFWPSEAAFSRHMVDVLADEGYEWVIVANSHLTRTVQNFDAVAGLGNITSNIDPPNRADRLGPTIPANQWWNGNKDGRGAWQAAPFAYQAHKVQYVNPTNGEVKKMTAVPMDDVISYLLGYEQTGVDAIPAQLVSSATNPDRPVIVLVSTDGENAWGGGYNSWQVATPDFMRQAHNSGYEATVIQKFVDDHPVPEDAVVHIEDGSWFNAANDWGHPQFINWLYPPVSTDPAKLNNLATRYDFETPGFAEDFRNWAVLMAGANWMETAEQIYKELNGENSVQAWRIQAPYQPDGTFNNPNAVERGWHIFLAGFDSGFMYYGDSLDDEVKQSLASNRAISQVKSLVESNGSLDRTAPTIFKPQRFPWNPGGKGWGPLTLYRPVGFNGADPWPSEFYIWTHVYDVSDVQNVTLRVRVDNDGINNLADNQNETFAGGSGVGGWIDIPMQKRELPRGNPTANSNLNFFIQPDHMADYYFAKITDLSVPAFRGKLLDYYVRAVDSRGNVSNSDIQHVFVEDDGQVPSSSVQFSANPSDCEPVTVTYHAANGPLEGRAPVTMQISFNGGSTWAAYNMSGGSNVWTYTISAPDNAPSATVYFESGAIVDSRNGQNWTTTIRDCDAPQGPVWTVPFTPVAGQPVTVYYDPAGRNLASATAVNIHHGYNENTAVNWTTPPGVAMTKDGNRWRFTYTLPANATIVRYVFNNTTGTWDNNGGGNWNIDVNGQPPPAEPPAAPGGLAAGEVGNTTIALAWSPAATATGYKIFRDGTLVATTSDTFYVSTGLTPKTSYAFTVKAVNALGDSPDTAPLTVTTLSNPLLAADLLILNPVGNAETANASYRFEGRAGSGFTSGLTWTNSGGGSGTIAFPGGNVSNGWDWTADIPLAVGSNTAIFSGLIPTAGSQTFADSPMNYTTFAAGQGQGAGFGVWSFNHSAANAGSFLAADHANMNVGTTKGFGLWANNGGRAAITRPFNSPMKSGDSFNVKFDNNRIQNSGQVGMELRDGAGVPRFRFFFVGGENVYRVLDGAGNRATQIAYTDAGLNLTLTLGDGDAYTFTTGSGEFSGNLVAGGPIARVEFFNSNAGNDTERNVYVGAMSHTVATIGDQTVAAEASVTRTVGGGGPADFDEWRGEEPATGDLLLDYAIGGAGAPDEAGEPVQVSRDGPHLLMTAIVRTGDSAVVVEAEAAADLNSSWSPEGVEMVDADDQTGLPAGCVRKVVRVPADGDRKFVRLRVIHTP